MFTPLSRSFYRRAPEIVAPGLLGKRIVRRIGTKFFIGRIVETEAYLSYGDEAAHNFRGKTARNQSLYKDGGHAYVHTMRQHALLDIVTERPDVPGSVLIRAVDPIEGAREMQKTRRVECVEDIANGPGKFCEAFNITRALDGVDLTDSRGLLFLAEAPEPHSPFSIEISTRIGISKAKDAPLRFCIGGHPCVSRVRTSK